MYIISTLDGMDYKVYDSDVIFDGNDEIVPVGEEVTFFYADIQIEGIVIMHSEDEFILDEKLKLRAKQLKNAEKILAADAERNDTSVVQRKRRRIIKKPWTPIDNKKTMGCKKILKTSKHLAASKKKASKEEARKGYDASQRRVLKAINDNRNDRLSGSKHQTSLSTDTWSESMADEPSIEEKKSQSSKIKDIRELKRMAQHSPTMTSTPAKKPLKSSVNHLKPEKLSSTSIGSILRKKIRSPSPTCSSEGKSLVRSSDRMTFDDSDTESESRPPKSRSTPISPTKEELKARLAKAEALINSRNRTKQARTKQVHHATKSLASSEESDGDEKTDDHVYGKNWTKEPMIHLQDNIYCRESIYDEVMAGSNKPTHVVRKLIEGVFNRSKLGNRTCTGRSDRTKGSNVVVEKSYPLNFAARNAIIDFAIDHAEETGAVEKKTKKELMATIAQKLCEIKDDLRRRQG